MEIDLDRDDVLTTKQAAKLLGIDLVTCYRWMLKGKLPAWRRVGRLVTTRRAVQALLVPVRVPKGEGTRGRTAAEAARERWREEARRK